jgi:hypothetical protein
LFAPPPGQELISDWSLDNGAAQHDAAAYLRKVEVGRVLAEAFTVQ